MTGDLSGRSATHRGVTTRGERARRRERLVWSAGARIYPAGPQPARRSPAVDDAETSTFTSPLSPTETVTEAIPAAATEDEPPPVDGCRSTVNGQRCGHAPGDHKRVGFEEWRVRCRCGCDAYRMPYAEIAKTIGYATLLAVPTGIVTLYAFFAVLEALVSAVTP